MNEPLEKKLIYLVDDDEDILILLKKILVNLGMEVETFLTPELFIKQIKKKLPDLCFIDLNFDTNLGAGFQLIQAIRKKISDKVILIVLSSRDASEDITQALEIGCDDYLTKPIRAPIIESKLRQHLKNFVEPITVMTTVPEELRPCSFGLGFYLYYISESGFTILTQHFIPKKTDIFFNSGILFEIMQREFTLRVQYNWIHSESGLYAASFNFPTDDRHFKTSFRKWMLLQDN